MKEHNSSFPPNSLDEQIEHLPGSLAQSDVRLIADLRSTYQPLAEKNHRSLARVWQRLAHSEAIFHSLETEPAAVGAELAPYPSSAPSPLPSAFSAPSSRRIHRLGAFMQTVAAVLIVGLLLSGFIALFATHRSTTAGHDQHPLQAMHTPTTQPQSANTNQPGSGACGKWSVVSSPNPPSSSPNLFGVAALATNNVWAVGVAVNPHLSSQTLTEHWNGSQWMIVASPNPSGSNGVLSGVAAVSASDIWAVGYSEVSQQQTLIEHWNGSQWSIVKSPNPGTSQDVLNAVAAISTNDVWAVGNFSNDGTNNKTLIEHWNGSQWSVVTSPLTTTNDFLSAVAASSANNIWAVGYSSKLKATRTLIERWDGSQWSIVPSPNRDAQNLLNGVLAFSANNVWTVGFSAGNTNATKTLIEHWNGTQWSIVKSPNPSVQNILNGVAATSTNDIWAAGFTFNAQNNQATLIEHWNGSQWNVVASPSPGSVQNALLAIASSPHSNRVWAVGLYGSSGKTTKTLTEFYC